jgi:hypothetical protein
MARTFRSAALLGKTRAFRTAHHATAACNQGRRVVIRRYALDIACLPFMLPLMLCETS